MKTCILYEGEKLPTQLLVKHKANFEHIHNVEYFSIANVDCNETREGGRDRRTNEHVIDHNKQDKNLHLLKHTRESHHTHA